MVACMVSSVPIQDEYVKHFADMLKKATPVHGTDAILKAYNIDGDVRIQYQDKSDFERIASQFGIFEEWKVKVLAFGFFIVAIILNLPSAWVK